VVLGCATALGLTAASVRAQIAPPAAGGAPNSNPAAAANPAPSEANSESASTAPAAPVPEAVADSALDTRSSAVAAYQAALQKRRLAPTEPLSTTRLREELTLIEQKLVGGRYDEVIGDLVYLVESPRFTPFAKSEEGRSARFLLGDTLGKVGAHDLARAYLIGLLDTAPSDIWYRKAVASSIDCALESERPRVFLADLKQVQPGAGEEIEGDIAYLTGRTLELEGKPAEALLAYLKVKERSRFWAQATYLAGVIEVERKNFKQGEAHFCKLADPKLTPKRAALFGGGDFFRVRDMARLGLGRVAHEQFRFDDARYYYYLVPADSERLPEALYETSTTRYEAKDYDGARESMDDLKKLAQNHVYEDEALILDAYIDLAVCRFPQADAKLNVFLKRYDPVRDAARKLASDEEAMRRLTEALRTGSDPAAAGLGVQDETARALGSLLRVDAGYGRATRRLAHLDYQMNGLLAAMSDLYEANRRLGTNKDLRPQAAGPLGQTDTEQITRAESQLAEVRRLVRAAEQNGKAGGADLAQLRQDLAALEIRVRAARAAGSALPPVTGAKAGSDLPELLESDRARASELYAAATALREQVLAQQTALAKDAFERLDRRLTRLLRRARLGRVETVLGKKRSLEIEIDALSQGLLPQTIVDSLDAARYLGDDEEYWPYEGEDWEDEYVGGEGLR
jgi:hypothetical protein